MTQADTPDDATTYDDGWELVLKYRAVGGSIDVTQRLKVPGGWLYRNIRDATTHGSPVTMTFVPNEKVGFHGN